MLKPTTKPTYSGNQWGDLAFYDYVHRKMVEAKAEITPEHVAIAFAEILSVAIPAGNA